MTGGAITCREAFSWHNKGRCVRSEVEEEVTQDEQAKLAAIANDVIAEAEDAEEDGEDDEASQLDGLASNRVTQRDSDPESNTSAGVNKVGLHRTRLTSSLELHQRRQE